MRVDGRPRKDRGFPLGMMDILTIEKTGESFRIMYDVKGRIILKPVKGDEAKFKLAKVTQKAIGTNKIPYVVTHDARTIRFPNPDVQLHDTVKIDIESGKITEFAKLENGNTCYITGGNNIGRIGVITHVEKHPGSFDIVHIKDANSKTFATRMGNVFILGKGKKTWISFPSDKGLYYTALEERKRKGSF